MAVFKCKMCGGTLEITEGSTTAVCEYCGSPQTLPRLSDDKLEHLYNRADHYRRNNEFDKAMGLYEQILNENGDDAESYWSLVLCRYGIEYVEDPTTHKRIPTVNRVQYTSIFDDDNYRSALKYADASQKSIYEQEAKTINEIQKGILDIAEKEDPFDVFICYKETDEHGERTRDSVTANDLYHELTQEGFKVFFAPITLEDKLGVAYEPYIFAALNSAKVMVVLGTKPEYFNAVWVKNEWSRYLALIKNGEKKVLIPAYRDMDPYDLPDEFSHLQAQDMNKLGFMPDLIRGIKKHIGTQYQVAPSPSAPQVASNEAYNVRLLWYGNRKLDCISVVRQTLNCGLKEAKDIVDTQNALLAKNLSLREAQRIEKIFQSNGFTVSVEEVSPRTNSAYTPSSAQGNVGALLKRVSLFLEASDWGNADAYCEKVLDIDPENGEAYVGKLLATLHVSRMEDIARLRGTMENMAPYKNAIRFSDEATATKLIELNRTAKENLERHERAQQEQARIERERKQAEEQRRQEINALRNARNNAASLIASKIREKEQLENLIAQKQAPSPLADNLKRVKKFAILVLLSFAACVISIMLIAGGTTSSIASSGSVSSAGTGTFTLMFLIATILFMIFSVKLLKADNKSAALVIINFFTYGIFIIVIAIIALRKCKKSKVQPTSQEINALNEQLQQAEAQIDNLRHSLSEINRKLEAYK